MSRSARFRFLQKRCGELRRHLLPVSFSATASYSTRVLDRARGYRVLVHAEIEAYLEDRVKELMLTAKRAWDADGTPSAVLIALMGYAKSVATVPSALPTASSNSTLRQRLDESVRHHAHRLKENHGIRTRNVLELLLPIGLDESVLDPVWVAQMDAFGVARGDIAHGSAMTVSSIDPATEFATVNDLLVGLEYLDEQLNALVR